MLAAIPPKHFDWYESVVTAVAGDDLTLRYADWPNEPTFVRGRTEVALLHSTYQPEPPLEPTA